MRVTKTPTAVFFWLPPNPCPGAGTSRAGRRHSGKLQQPRKFLMLRYSSYGLLLLALVAAIADAPHLTALRFVDRSCQPWPAAPRIRNRAPV